MGAHINLSQAWSSGFQTLPYFKYNNVLKWGNRFTSELNAAKNMDYMERRFK